MRRGEKFSFFGFKEAVTCIWWGQKLDLILNQIRFNFKSNLKNRRKKNLMLMWKIVKASKALVLYIYID